MLTQSNLRKVDDDDEDEHQSSIAMKEQPQVLTTIMTSHPSNPVLTLSQPQTWKQMMSNRRDKEQ